MPGSTGVRALEAIDQLGGSCLRPSGCLPPTELGSLYTAGPGECIPAVASAVCSCETKTLLATSRVAAPKPKAGAVLLLLLICEPKVELFMMFILAPSNPSPPSPPPPMAARRAGCVVGRGWVALGTVTSLV